ncbi:hypothetical protein IQ235_06785 [Oscillatoriales cyanobacterium LEGE 11467]|uniref:Uncharacterized protein n=1 Tax=Zarconia navalis LEGE 11467 TaxID=1828826 RepID=A0A928Z8G0_9CYAN|nr:hypothetical protein [Zarconia navalis]MBE9040494.1 hypothetical protein [Zarconia navalis LEGE 11467]
MTDFTQLSTNFLTTDEAARVDAALMSSQEKFATRLAIYALRSLDRISTEMGKPIESISPQEIGTWIASDRTLQAQIEIDASFASFFTHLVLSSLNPLKQAARSTGVAIDNLSVLQVITWFEQEAARRVRENP